MANTIGSIEAARRLGITRQRVRMLCERGRIAGAYQVGEPPRVTWRIPVRANEIYFEPEREDEHLRLLIRNRAAFERANLEATREGLTARPNVALRKNHWAVAAAKSTVFRLSDSSLQRAQAAASWAPISPDST